MNTYVIRRRNAWKNAQEREATVGVVLAQPPGSSKVVTRYAIIISSAS